MKKKNRLIEMVVIAQEKINEDSEEFLIDSRNREVDDRVLEPNEYLIPKKFARVVSGIEELGFSVSDLSINTAGTKYTFAFTEIPCEILERVPRYKFIELVNEYGANYISFTEKKKTSDDYLCPYYELVFDFEFKNLIPNDKIIPLFGAMYVNDAMNIELKHILRFIEDAKKSKIVKKKKKDKKKRK